MTWSDMRYKTNIVPFENALSYILKIQGVRYDWKTNEFPDLNFPKGEQIGVVAQDVEKILPELVLTGPDGFKSVSYEKFTPVLIEAMKEQQKIIDSQNVKLENQSVQLKDQESRIEDLEKAVNTLLKDKK